MRIKINSKQKYPVIKINQNWIDQSYIGLRNKQKKRRRIVIIINQKINNSDSENKRNNKVNLINQK